MNFFTADSCVNGKETENLNDWSLKMKKINRIGCLSCRAVLILIGSSSFVSTAINCLSCTKTNYEQIENPELIHYTTANYNKFLDSFKPITI